MQSGKVQVQSKTNPKFQLVNKPSQISSHKVLQFYSLSLVKGLNPGVNNQINHQSIIPSTDVIQLTLTLKMTTAQAVETSVTVNNNSAIQDYVHPDDQTQPTFERGPGELKREGGLIQDKLKA